MSLIDGIEEYEREMTNKEKQEMLEARKKFFDPQYLADISLDLAQNGPNALG